MGDGHLYTKSTEGYLATEVNLWPNAAFFVQIVFRISICSTLQTHHTALCCFLKTNGLMLLFSPIQMPKYHDPKFYSLSNAEKIVHMNL